jgi:hypothetical protein
MRRVAIFVFVALVAWYFYGQYRAGAYASYAPPRPAAAGASPVVTRDFKCDQRTVCSQMTSCAEAKFFQKNCPDVDLRPDSAGLPCPKWWCTSPDAP